MSFERRAHLFSIAGLPLVLHQSARVWCGQAAGSGRDGYRFPARKNHQQHAAGTFDIRRAGSRVGFSIRARGGAGETRNMNFKLEASRSLKFRILPDTFRLRPLNSNLIPSSRELCHVYLHHERRATIQVSTIRERSSCSLFPCFGAVNCGV